MNKANLVYAGRYPVQAFPLAQGLINLTSTDGAIAGVSLVHCAADGTITITWSDATTTDVDMIQGEDYAIVDATSVTISSGTFHFGY